MRKLYAAPLLQPLEAEALPPALQHAFDALINPLIVQEKNRCSNKLEPFAKHAEKLRLKSQEVFLRVNNQLKRGLQLVKEGLKQQKRSDLLLIWQKAEEHYKKLQSGKNVFSKQESSVQEQSALPDEFLHAGYAIAKNHLAENRLQDAADIFLFLSVLQPRTYEYLLGRASALQRLQEFEEAIVTYMACLPLAESQALALADGFYRTIFDVPLNK